MRDARGGSLSVSVLEFLKLLVLVLLLVAAAPLFAAEKIVASRVWPSQEYTRVTLESAHAVRFQTFFVSDPQRLVVDLDGVELNAELKSLPARIGDADPYIRTVRVGLNRPGVVRVVFDLRTEVKPSVFALAPAGEYKHRLVLDIYPAHPADPLLALVAPRTDPIGEIARAPLIPSTDSTPERSPAKPDGMKGDLAAKIAAEARPDSAAELKLSIPADTGREPLAVAKAERPELPEASGPFLAKARARPHARAARPGAKAPGARRLAPTAS